jgi:hypothetical protein
VNLLIVLTYVALGDFGTNLQGIEEMYRAGEYELARDLTIESWERLSEHQRADAERILRKIYLREGDASGAEVLAQSEVDRRLALGCEMEECTTRLCDAIESGIYIAQLRREDAEAEDRWQFLYQQQCTQRAHESSRMMLISGHAAMKEMRLPAAWYDLTIALTAARARNDLIDELNALGALVELASRLGRIDLVSEMSSAAWSTRRELLSSLDNERDRGLSLAVYLNNIGWSLLLLREAGYPTADPTLFLAPSLAIVESVGANWDIAKAGNIRINLALAAVQELAPMEASEWLRPVAEHSLNNVELFWLRIVSARSEALQDRFEAAHTQADQVERLANQAADPEMRARAAQLRGRIYERQGRSHDALRAYAEAERHLDDLTVPVGLGQGRDHYIYELQRGSRYAIELQLKLGRFEDALCMLRLSRGRTQRGLVADAELRVWTGLESRSQLDAEGERCRAETSPARRSQCLGVVEHRRRELRRELSSFRPRELTRRVGCQDLRPVEEGEVVVAYVRLSAGWHALVSNGLRAAAFPLGEIDTQATTVALGAQLLDPLDAWLVQARRLRVLPTEDLHAIDFHILPWRTRPLLMHVPVAYGLDLPRADATIFPDSRAAVVVADPTATLRVFDEGIRVAAVLESGRLTPEVLFGVGEAVRDEVIPLLRNRLTHLYIGGHAGQIPSAMSEEAWLEPEDLWDTVIRLEGDTVVSVEDLLTEVPPRTAPAVVVLFTCKSGLIDHATFSGGVGLAQAFLVRGSHAVVGTTREVNDAVAHGLSMTMYESWDPDLQFDAPLLLARSQAALIAQGYSTDDVGRVRVWVR